MKNNKLIKQIIEKGKTLEEKLNMNQRNHLREDSNPQTLWTQFKTEVMNEAKMTKKKAWRGQNGRKKWLQKDLKEIANDLNLDKDKKIRTNEAMMANELAHLEKMEGKNNKDLYGAIVATHGEKLGGVWSMRNKENKLRDILLKLEIPNTFPKKYKNNTKRMAKLARDYHENLQTKDINPQENKEDYKEELDLLLHEIPRSQRLSTEQASAYVWKIEERNVSEALRQAKMKSATGMDGCPFELWKELNMRHDQAIKSGNPGFNIIQTLTRIYRDIQTNGIDKRTNFAEGWICPLYKKKDPRDISNYRPIMLLNTDYKLMTKALTLQLQAPIHKLIHRDQAGFIPKRSIYDHIRLAKMIINYADIMEVDGAIVALNQEKAYNWIRHNYLWKTLEAFRIPEMFIRTVRALYQEAHTKVAINGTFSEPFQVTRGVRQGDPLLCLLFDIAIEPLACRLRNTRAIQGLSIPGLENSLRLTLFANNTNLFLSKDDNLDDAEAILQSWCKLSGAKFNIEKTEIIPIGSPEHRLRMTETRKLSGCKALPLSDHIKIMEDGTPVCILGAWIGNNIEESTAWEAILDKTKKKLTRWENIHPTPFGKRIITQAVVGGHTQFLTKAQGMPPNIEKAVTKLITDFMWGEDKKPRIAMDSLFKPLDEGGLQLLNIKARNEAIDLMWLKAYLNLTPTRPTWAIVTDTIIRVTAPYTIEEDAKVNCFLQGWKPPTRGIRAKILGNDITKLVKIARKHNVNLAAIRIDPKIRKKLPAWHHLHTKKRPRTTNAAKCLLKKHGVKIVADLCKVAERVRPPNQNRIPHKNSPRCACKECILDRINGCRDPNKCVTEALNRINDLAQKFNLSTLRDPHDNLSLT